MRRRIYLSLIFVITAPIFVLFQNFSSPLDPIERSSVRSSGACYSLEDNGNLPFEFVQAVPPPVDKSDGLLREISSSYPATGFATQRVGSIQSEYSYAPSGHRYANHLSLWANFCVNLDKDKKRDRSSLAKCANVRKHKGNHYPDPLEVETVVDGEKKMVEVRPVFTSYKSANYCTLAQAAHLLGYDKERVVQKYLDKGGLKSFYRKEDDKKELKRRHHKSVYVDFADITKEYFVDLCILKKNEDADPKGVFLDYEVADGRSNKTTVAFIRKLKSLLDNKNKELIVWTNNLRRSDETGIHGIDHRNLKNILRHVDAFGFAVYNGSDANGYESVFKCAEEGETFMRSFNRQWEVVKKAYGSERPPGDKFLPLVSLFDLNQKEAYELHERFLSLDLKGLRLWRHGADGVGSCNQVNNLVIRCLAFGESGGWSCSDTSKRVPCRYNNLTCRQMKNQNKKCEKEE